MADTKPESEKKTHIAPFGVEATHPRMCDLLLQAIPGCRLRSEIAANKPAKNQYTGEERVPQDQAIGLGRFPTIPGMQLHVNPDKLTYAVVDPLHGDDEMLAKIKAAIDSADTVRVNTKLGGVPRLDGTLDIHRMKTLCREILWLLKAGDVHVIKGVAPTQEDVDGMVGHYMLNPGSQVQNLQPRFERDWDAYVESLSTVGG